MSIDSVCIWWKIFINYNAIKDNGEVNELINKLVQEEVRLKSRGSRFINHVGEGANAGLNVKTSKFEKKNNIPLNVTNGEKK